MSSEIGKPAKKMVKIATSSHLEKSSKHLTSAITVNEHKILDTFEEMRQELIATKAEIEEEVDAVIEEKKRFEADLENLCGSPERRKAWRTMKKRLGEVIVAGRLAKNQKILGVPLAEPKPPALLEGMTEEEKHKAKEQANDEYEKELFAKMSKLEIQEPKDKHRIKWIVYPESKFKLYWSLAMIVMLSYVVLVSPLSLDVIDLGKYPGLIFMEFFISVFFLCDIVIVFRSALKNYNEVIDDYRIIGCKYLQGWFILDLASSLPIDVIAILSNNQALAQYSLLIKIPRFIRLIRAAKFIQTSEELWKSPMIKSFSSSIEVNPKVMAVVRIVVILSVVVHVVGCIWLFIGESSEGSPNNWLVKYGIQDSSQSDKYLRAIYWAVTTFSTVGYGDVVPVNNIEKIFTIFWMCFGAAFYSFIVSSLSSAVSDTDST